MVIIEHATCPQESFFDTARRVVADTYFCPGGPTSSPAALVHTSTPDTPVLDEGVAEELRQAAKAATSAEPDYFSDANGDDWQDDWAEYAHPYGDYDEAEYNSRAGAEYDEYLRQQQIDDADHFDDVNDDFSDEEEIIGGGGGGGGGSTVTVGVPPKKRRRSIYIADEAECDDKEEQ